MAIDDSLMTHLCKYVMVLWPAGLLNPPEAISSAGAVVSPFPCSGWSVIAPIDKSTKTRTCVHLKQTFWETWHYRAYLSNFFDPVLNVRVVQSLVIGWLVALSL